jgi:hypothetical protein
MLKRGEIWSANLGRGARGTELGAKLHPMSGRNLPWRPALIVSSEAFNAERDRVTIAPLMHYRDFREYTIEWGMCLPLSDIAMDPSNSEHGSLYKDSLVDCGQLWTIHAPRRSRAAEANRAIPRDINFDRRCGEIKDHLRLNITLQIAVGGGITGMREEMEFGHGDILSIDYPGRPKQRCLVISHSLVDLRRHRTVVHRPFRRQLNQTTVVPLEPFTLSDDGEIDPGTALVEVADKTSPRQNMWLAICQEICTIDWQERRPTLLGSACDMRGVNEAVREYLDLPSLTEDR